MNKTVEAIDAWTVKSFIFNDGNLVNAIAQTWVAYWKII